MSDLTARVESIILEKDLIASGESIVVAVSGGLDSTVLLHLLHSLSQRHGWSLVVAHFNHQLRGRGSDADESFVRQLAKSFRLPFKAGRAAVRPFARRHKLSIEMAARQLRHAFLARTALGLRSKKILLAHHADDQLELFFLRLLRGTGPEGLAGMRSSGPSPANPKIELIRPLLPIARADLEAFAAEQRIRFREDATNAQLDNERNRIRHELLPLLRSEFQPALDQTISRLMEIIRAESEFMAQQSTEAQAEGSIPFSDLHPALQRRWLRSQCQRLGVAPAFDLVERLRLTPGAQWMIDPTRVLSRDPSGTVHCRTLAPAFLHPAGKLIRIGMQPGAVVLEGVTLTWRIKRVPGESGLRDPAPRRPCLELSGMEVFDADKLGKTLRVRHWQPGDRFQPIGMPTSVKLQDLFVNRKIPRTQRQHLIVAETAAGDIFWVEGLRISERFKLDPGTRHRLEWSWERNMDQRGSR